MKAIHDTLENPFTIIKENGIVDVYQKIVKEHNKQYLYRVFVNTGKIPPLVITAYKTSKTGKYENPV